MFGITFFKRDFAKQVQPWFGFKVNWLEWQAMGGASAGQVEVGPGPAMLDLVGLLRCPVEVWQDGGGLVWWGFVNAIAGEGYRVDLDNLANRVACVYLYNGSDTAKNGSKVLTSWASDAESILAYGTKEMIISIGQASDELAIYQRDVYLAEHKTPVMQRAPVIAPRDFRGVAGSTPSTPTFVLDLKGWWSTLDWKHYASSVGKLAYTDASGSLQNLGDLTANTQIAQVITPGTGGWASQKIHLALRKWGAPADDFTIDFCSDTAGAPGAVIGTATLAGGSCPTGMAWYIFNMSASVTLAAATPYWIVCQRSGAVDAVNFYQVRINEGMGFSAPSMKLWDGAAWADRVPSANLNFALIGLTETSLQASSMLASTEAGQFLTGNRFDAASGVYSCAWRDGFGTGLDEVQELLAGGNASGGLLLATVERGRLVRVRNKPGADWYVLQADGTVTTRSGIPVSGNGMVGNWARLAGPALVPAGGSVAMARDVWIDGARWVDGRYFLY